jgi:predicted Zn-dependent protease
MNIRTALSSNMHSFIPPLTRPQRTAGAGARCLAGQLTRPSRGSWRRPTGQRPASQLSQPDQDCLLRQQSLAAARQGNYTAALAGLTRLLERHPHSAKDFNNRGLVYLQAGQPAAALADYNRALEINPKLASVYNNRANYYAAQNQLAEAILDYETAIDLEPTNIRAWINQGMTFRDLGMLSQAIENFDQAFYIYQLVRRDTSETALLECHLYAQRGRTYEIAGDWNCAIADYHTALVLIARNETPSNLIDRLHSQVNEWLGELLCPLP